MVEIENRQMEENVVWVDVDSSWEARVLQFPLGPGQQYKFYSSQKGPIENQAETPERFSEQVNVLDNSTK